MSTKQKIKHLIETTEMTLQQIADTVGSTYKVVWRVSSGYSKEFRSARKRISYQKSKTGELNPMKGKYGEAHHNYKGLVSDNKGYHMILKPDWYTGRKGSKHIFFHSVVVCNYMGLTEIPAKHVVHHCNGLRLDNRFENLVLLTNSEHLSLHAEIERTEGVSTISKESTLKWVEARRAGNSHDIVTSAWEHAAVPEGGQGLTNLVEDNAKHTQQIKRSQLPRRNP